MKGYSGNCLETARVHLSAPKRRTPTLVSRRSWRDGLDQLRFPAHRQRHHEAGWNSPPLLKKTSRNSPSARLTRDWHAGYMEWQAVWRDERQRVYVPWDEIDLRLPLKKAA